MKATKTTLSLIALISAVIMTASCTVGCSGKQQTEAPTEKATEAVATEAAETAAPETKAAETKADDEKDQATEEKNNDSSATSSLSKNSFKLDPIEPVKVKPIDLDFDMPTIAKFHIDTYTLRAATDDLDFDIKIDENTGEVTLPSNMLFASDSAELSSKAKDDLKKFIDAYTKSVLADKSKVSKIVIEGHTDTDGSHEYNQTLSEKRANNVMNYCLELHPELKDYLVAKGCSYDKPVYKSNGDVDKDASLRVVFRAE